jgi:subtilase family serine protease
VNKAVLPTLLAIGLASAATGAAQASPSPDVVAGVPRARVIDFGRAPATTPMRLALTLRYRNQAALDALVEAQSDPRSPLFQQWLTAAQFRDAFSPGADSYARVIGSLKQAGFRVTGLFDNRTVVDAEASAAVVERYFSTEIHRVQQPQYGIRLANVKPAAAPQALRGLLVAVNGLNTLTHVHSLAVPGRGGAAPDSAGPPLHGPTGGFGPLAFSQGYDLPNQHGYDGSKQNVGVVIDADYSGNDLKHYLSYFNVNRGGKKTTRIYVDGGPPHGNSSPDSIETTLDVETIVSNEPGVGLYVYEFPNFNNDGYITDAYNAVVNRNDVGVANSSFGGCEFIDPPTEMAWDNIAEQGNSEGITFAASTGDYGAFECGSLGVSVPASAPHFVAVGGTSLAVNSNGNWVSEAGWSGSGGGVSQVFAKPSWEKLKYSGRYLPDLAFDGDPNTGAAVYWRGGWSVWGGTSLSSPIFSAAMSEINAVTGHRHGNFGKTLHTFYQNHNHDTYFRDVTSGNNGYYSAGSGFDLVTGMGSARVWSLANAL